MNRRLIQKTVEKLDQIKLLNELYRVVSNKCNVETGRHSHATSSEKSKSQSRFCTSKCHGAIG